MQDECGGGFVTRRITFMHLHFHSSGFETFRLYNFRYGTHDGSAHLGHVVIADILPAEQGARATHLGYVDVVPSNTCTFGFPA